VNAKRSITYCQLSGQWNERSGDKLDTLYSRPSIHIQHRPPAETILICDVFQRGLDLKLWIFNFCSIILACDASPSASRRCVQCLIFRLRRTAAQVFHLRRTRATGGCLFSTGGVRRIRRPGGNTACGKDWKCQPSYVYAPLISFPGSRQNARKSSNLNSFSGDYVDCVISLLPWERLLACAACQMYQGFGYSNHQPMRASVSIKAMKTVLWPRGSQTARKSSNLAIQWRLRAVLPPWERLLACAACQVHQGFRNHQPMRASAVSIEATGTLAPKISSKRSSTARRRLARSSHSNYEGPRWIFVACFELL
jgi:hypothetical protein